jgi:hypothetical protein
VTTEKTTEVTTKKRRNPPNRTTKNLGIWVSADVIERTKRDTPAGWTRSDYVAALILGQETNPKPAGDLSALALAGNRVVTALRNATDPGLITELQALRVEIVAGLMTARKSYDSALDRRAHDDDWSGQG